MTDLEKFIELYKSFGIALEAQNEKEGNGKFIYMGVGDNEKFTGYACFCSFIFFDENGKFTEQSFVE